MTTFYSLNLENYEAIADNLQEAVGNDELLEELRQSHVIVKLKLIPLSSETGELTKIVVPDFTLPDIDLEQVYSLLPHKQEIRAVFENADFQQEVQENLALFASQHFEFGGTLDEN